MIQIKKISDKLKRILFLALIISAFSLLGTSEAKAGSEHNVYGWAWSENIGWISFSPAGSYPETPNYSAYADLPGLGQICPGGAAGDYKVCGWARACSVFNSGCSGTLNTNRGDWDGWIKLYNISIDTTSNPAQFHNWAWGGNTDNDTMKSVIGWVSFNCAEGGNCGTYNYKVVTTLSISVDGVCGTATTPPTIYVYDGSTTPISTNLCLAGTPPSTNPILPAAAGSTVTWICRGLNGGSDVNNCTATRIANRPPQILNGANTKDYCAVGQGAGYEYFGWNYADPDNNPELRFQFQADNNSDFSSLEINNDVTGLSNPNGTYNSQSAIVSLTPTIGQIAFNTAYYYWRVKVYDNQGADSGWYYGGTTTTPPGASFKTASHPWPTPAFNFSPSTPLINKVVSFTESSVCYDANNNSQPCSAIGTTTYLWTFGDGSICDSGADINCKGNVSHTYTSSGTYAVTLKVCDDLRCCSITNNVPVKTSEGVPGWSEISPF